VEIVKPQQDKEAYLRQVTGLTHKKPLLSYFPLTQAGDKIYIAGEAEGLRDNLRPNRAGAVIMRNPKYRIFKRLPEDPRQ
jgi:hypothetical protein